MSLPKNVQEYLNTGVGQTMIEGAIWFSWSISGKKIVSSGNTLNFPERLLAMPDLIIFVKTDKGWQRLDAGDEGVRLAGGP